MANAVEKKDKPGFIKRVGNFFKRIGRFFKNMYHELKKVTWPSKKELIRQSVVVVVFVLLLTIVVGLMDAGLSALLKLVI